MYHSPLLWAGIFSFMTGFFLALKEFCDRSVADLDEKVED